MSSYPAGMTVSNRALIMLSDALRQNRATLGTRWRRLEAGQQALLVVAHLRKGETYPDLAAGFGIGTTTVFRYIREALDVLAALAITLHQAIEAARRKAFVILDGTLVRIDRVGMGAGRDRPYYSGKHKCHGMNVQVLADPAGRLIWASPALPGARHDMGAATTWVRPANTASLRPSTMPACMWWPTLATRAPDRRSRCRSAVAASTRTPADAGGCRGIRSRSTPRTPACAGRVSARTRS